MSSKCATKSTLAGIMVALAGMGISAVLKDITLEQRLTYGFSAAILGFALKSEAVDCFCDEHPGGAPAQIWFRDRPHETDPPRILMAKIESQAVYRNHEVVWRRSYILSMLVLLSVWGLSVYKLPTSREWITSLIVTWCILFKMHMTYTYHYESQPTNNILTAIEYLSKNMLNQLHDNRALKTDIRKED